MKENKEKMQLPKVTLDDFFTSQEERDEKKSEIVKKIEIRDISNFPNHPYQVRDDEEMYSLAENIKETGLIYPILVRPKQDGGYEMISGHRRKRACEIAGITEISAIIRNMSDEEATIQMVDSNKQREKILPSEKAFAYKMRLEAMKRQGERNDLTSVQVAQKSERKTSREILGEEVGESQDQVRRYIRLTELIPELLQFVDNNYLKDKENIGIALSPAVEVSYLTKKEQDILLEAMETSVATPSTAQAKRLREESEKGTLTEDKIYEILDEEKPNQKEQIKFKYDKVKEYFPKNYTVQQMQNVIEKLLKQYQLKWQRDNDIKNYSR